jgi:hypothetical protein
MDAGSRSGEVAEPAAAAIPWLRATGLWMLMMVAETANGFAREVFVAPAIGALRARQAGVLVGSLVVLFIAWAGSRRLGARTRRSQLVVGAYWVVLTTVFEISVGRAMDLSWSRILSDYNPAEGGWMLLGLAVMFIAPMFASRMRS